MRGRISLIEYSITLVPEPMSNLLRLWFASLTRRLCQRRKGEANPMAAMSDQNTILAELLARPNNVGIAASLVMPNGGQRTGLVAKLPPFSVDLLEQHGRSTIMHSINFSLYSTGPLITISLWFPPDNFLLTHFFFNPAEPDDLAVLKPYIEEPETEFYVVAGLDLVARYTVLVDKESRNAMAEVIAECQRFLANVPTDLLDYPASRALWLSTVGKVPNTEPNEPNER